MKILMLCIIITFFMPFFSVSCNPNDAGVNLSGFDISTGKTVGENWYRGNLFGFTLIVPTVILLISSVYIYDTKKAMLYNIYKNALFITPVFNIFAVFIIRYVFKPTIAKIIIRNSPFSISYDTAINIAENFIDIKYGFILYILFNAAVFGFAVAHYFMKRE